MKQDRLSSIQIQGKGFDKTKDYLVVTHDYLQHGGDGMEFFKNPVALYPIEYKVRDVLIDRLRALDTLRGSLDGRFVKIE
jgi:5'-nucleotidase